MSNASYPNPGIKWGLIASVVIVLAGLGLYYTDQQTLFSLKFNFIQLFICAVTGLLAGLEQKRKAGGYSSFKEALQPIFITFVIGTLVGTLFMYIIANYVDPGLPARMKAGDLKALEQMEAAQKAAGINDSRLSEQLTQLKQQDYSLTLVASILSYLTGLFLDFIIAAILAVVIRKKQIA
ncbi:DUF4199 domain-containing protein [Chitinophaga ginsengisoli]|uniref:Uncharacterized protein DUF4199 n=1 Tax=Chitinophaga ginsengisoli TaxID=363837 RepID=A0A2P8FNV0_9BACT|nr:DUF4199 domain-containing protein [Chitinophaga ginsengisoli]PSL23396.1 uncharacterized protein DUF4199 [Chitinophaga ginsengisoli]